MGIKKNVWQRPSRSRCIRSSLYLAYCGSKMINGIKYINNYKNKLVQNKGIGHVYFIMTVERTNFKTKMLVFMPDSEWKGHRRKNRYHEFSTCLIRHLTISIFRRLFIKKKIRLWFVVSYKSAVPTYTRAEFRGSVCASDELAH